MSTSSVTPPHMPGVRRRGDIHEAGKMKVVWFKDPDGNILSVQNDPTRH